MSLVIFNSLVVFSFPCLCLIPTACYGKLRVPCNLFLVSGYYIRYSMRRGSTARPVASTFGDQALESGDIHTQYQPSPRIFDTQHASLTFRQKNAFHPRKYVLLPLSLAGGVLDGRGRLCASSLWQGCHVNHLFAAKDSN